MRFVSLTLLILSALVSAGCGRALLSQQPTHEWSVGFWYWQGSSPGNWPDSKPLDVLYFQAGTVDQAPGRDPSVWGALPNQLPAAREYWMVFRFDRQAPPGADAEPLLANTFARLLALARARGWNIAGVQLDIDCPTSRLGDYAQFLRQLRQDLPPAMQISSTALLDWFRRPGDVAQVIQAVDEFVPQFYDLGPPGSFDQDAAIAAKIDATEWGPVFNRYGKRFRIGVSSFGRAESAPPLTPVHGRSPRFGGYFADLTPLDFASNAAFHLETRTTTAGELVLTYRATRKVRLGYSEFEAGDGVQFMLPSRETTRAAVRSARQMGANCAGVVFFRWPTDNETLVMEPGEVLAAAGAAPPAAKQIARIEALDGSCAAVKCVDLYFLDPDPLRPTPVRYRIRSSTDLAYFLPEERMPVRMTGPSELELSLPAYGGRRHMLLGRAVTQARAEFTVQEAP